jgi:C2H2-type zinc finger protein/C2H2 type zinc finger protein
MNQNAQRTCHKCNKSFPYPRDLKKHLARKTPCAPIVDVAELSAADLLKEYSCRYCGRTFTTATAMSRHVKHRCQIANSEEGMEKLMEHTLQRQMAEMSARIDKLTTLLEKQAILVPQIQPQAAIQIAGQVNTGPVTNNILAPVLNTVNQTVINIVPWDSERRISVDTKQIAAAFAENARVREYTKLSDYELADPEIAPPYVTELLMDLVKRAHTDPANRNVYLSAQRADQALVLMENGRWEVVALQEATRLMFDGVAKQMHRLMMTYEELRKLPLEAQNALSMAGLMYEDEPDEYAKRAKGPMAAHLTNCRDGRGAGSTKQLTNK